MSTCPVIPLDLNSRYATLLDGKRVAAVTRRAIDWSDWRACNGAGVTLQSSTWGVHADDDDGALTLSQDDLTDDVASVLITGGTAAQAYRLENTITTSDGQTLVATVRIPVSATAL